MLALFPSRKRTHTRTHTQAQTNLVQTCTRSGKASKRKAQGQEDKQERRATCTHPEAKLHVWRGESKMPGVNMESAERSDKIALSRKLKKQPNTPKSGSKYHAKASLQTTQETKSPRTMSEAQNNQIWVAGTPIMHAKRIPNSPPKHTKTTQNQDIITYAKEH